MACGELGLEINYFYSLTPRQFSNIIIGYRRKEDLKHKDSWEQTRYLMYYTLLPYSDKKDLTPQDVIKFPWEEEKQLPSKKPKSQKELQELFKKFDKQDSDEI